MVAIMLIKSNKYLFLELTST